MSSRPQSKLNETDLTRSELAKKSNVGPETIRFYEKKGLLRPAYRDSSNYRRYGQEELERLSFIKKAKALGFTLPEISEFLELKDFPENICRETRELAKFKVNEIDARILELTHFRSQLVDLVKRCRQSEAEKSCAIMDYLDDKTDRKKKQK